jgi:hypothetical protein
MPSDTGGPLMPRHATPAASMPIRSSSTAAGKPAIERPAGARRAVFQVGTGISKNPRISALFVAKSLILEKTPSSTYPVFSSTSPLFPLTGALPSPLLSLS